MKKISLSLKSIEPLFDKIAKLSKLQRILIFIGVLAILIGPFVYFIYLPKDKQIKELTGTYEQMQTTLAKLEAKARQLQKYQAMLKEAESQFKIVKKALPEQKDMPDLLTNISRSGQDAGLEFLLFQPASEIQQEFYVEIPVAIKVQGTYHEVAAFFDKIATLSRVVNIQDIKMVRAGKGSNLTTTCKAVTYQFREAAQKGKAPAK